MMDVNFKSWWNYVVSKNYRFEFFDFTKLRIILVGTDTTMMMCEHLIDQGKIYSTVDKWTFFPYQPYVELGLYDEVWNFIHYNPGEWGCTFEQVKAFLESKFFCITDYKVLNYF